MSSFRLLALRAQTTMAVPRAAMRSYHAAPALRYAYKDTQDRESLKPTGTEGTRSGRDGDTAEMNPDAAFNPDKTSPEEARRTGGSELDVSGANQEVSKPQGDEKAPNKSDKEVRKGGSSGGGSPPKKGQA